MSSFKNEISIQSILNPSKSELSLSDFDYEYRSENVAQKPLHGRDSSRLLVHHENGINEDKLFKDLPDLLKVEKPLIIRNSSQVLKARLFGETDTGARVEIFLLEPSADLNFSSLRWRAIGRPLKKLKTGKCISFNGEGSATVVGHGEEVGGITPIELEFQIPEDFELTSWLQNFGQVPLPPYISRNEGQNAEDETRYQTVYSEQKGSVAAPTAGLHFTDEIFTQLKNGGCEIVDCTLHVGAGTFLPVKSQDINNHTMHQEWCRLERSTVEKLIDAKAKGRPILAIGTTAFRAVESFAIVSEGSFENMKKNSDSYFKTDLFINPKNKSDLFRPFFISRMITNFHQPQSTLLMMISALIGFEETMAMYKHAVSENYRLFSYGDSSLLKLPN